MTDPWPGPRRTDPVLPIAAGHGLIVLGVSVFNQLDKVVLLLPRPSATAARRP